MASVTGVNSNPIQIQSGANLNQAETKLPELDQLDQRAVLAALQILANAQAQSNNGSSLQELTLSLGKYRGEVRNGVPHGQGTLNYSSTQNRLKYEGDFEEGVPHGQGVLTWLGGDTFRGHMEKGDPFKGTYKSFKGDATWTGTCNISANGVASLNTGSFEYLDYYGWQKRHYVDGRIWGTPKPSTCCTIS